MFVGVRLQKHHLSSYTYDRLESQPLFETLIRVIHFRLPRRLQRKRPGGCKWCQLALCCNIYRTINLYLYVFLDVGSVNDIPTVAINALAHILSNLEPVLQLSSSLGVRSQMTPVHIAYFMIRNVSDCCLACCFGFCFLFFCQEKEVFQLPLNGWEK